MARVRGDARGTERGAGAHADPHPCRSRRRPASPAKAPAASNAHVRKSMQGNTRATPKPELIVRKLLRELGYPGYRLQWGKLPGRPDIVFPGRKLGLAGKRLLLA